jgi:hypothetical protein
VTFLEIAPEPDEGERKAIAAALAAEEAERPGGSAWAEALLPTRAAEDDRPVTLAPPPAFPRHVGGVHSL